MSFTLSHVAAAIPIKDMKTKDGQNLFDLTALVLGCMAPDFEFYIHLQPIKQSMSIPYGHTFSGMFFYDLPFCFLFAWIFHTIIKKPLLLHLPQPYAQRYAKFVRQKWHIDLQSLLVFSYSAILAMTIHILWDSFTHINSPVVQHIVFLSLPVSIFTHTIPLCKLLDHIGSITGLATVAYYLYSFDHNVTSDPIIAISAVRKTFYFAMIVSSGIGLTFYWLYRYGVPSDMNDMAGPIIAFVSGLSIGITLLSYLFSKVYELDQPTNLTYNKPTDF